jgi:hypothetical protein
MTSGCAWVIVVMVAMVPAMMMMMMVIGSSMLGQASVKAVNEGVACCVLRVACWEWGSGWEVGVEKMVIHPRRLSLKFVVQG